MAQAPEGEDPAALTVSSMIKVRWGVDCPHQTRPSGWITVVRWQPTDVFPLSWLPLSLN